MTSVQVKVLRIFRDFVLKMVYSYCTVFLNIQGTYSVNPVDVITTVPCAGGILIQSYMPISYTVAVSPGEVAGFSQDLL